MKKKAKSFKVLGVAIMLGCAFQLGRIYEETEFLKRIDVCVKAPENVSLKEFYGHSIDEGNLWNHAVGHNANIYINCIFKDLNR